MSIRKSQTKSKKGKGGKKPTLKSKLKKLVARFSMSEEELDRVAKVINKMDDKTIKTISKAIERDPKVQNLSEKQKEEIRKSGSSLKKKIRKPLLISLGTLGLGMLGLYLANQNPDKVQNVAKKLNRDVSATQIDSTTKEMLIGVGVVSAIVAYALGASFRS